MAALPTRIEGLPVLVLSQMQERILIALAPMKPVKRTALKRAIWLDAAHPKWGQALSGSIYALKHKLAPHGYLIHCSRQDGYTLMRDTRFD